MHAGEVGVLGCMCACVGCERLCACSYVETSLPQNEKVFRGDEKKKKRESQNA